eukprot:3522238-Pyramimonas_sp.AAC.1
MGDDDAALTPAERQLVASFSRSPGSFQMLGAAAFSDAETWAAVGEPRVTQTEARVARAQHLLQR